MELGVGETLFLCLSISLVAIDRLGMTIGQIFSRGINIQKLGLRRAFWNF